ncbi:YdeI family protein [Microbacterium sp. NPDC055910]|uniref:YdeI/OmpD-associated family protein n=1 Tax=Microbacterium sp. NPDC055910 TaxID=3345659 RepID=UPI0035DA4F90
MRTPETEPVPLVVADADAWRAWLIAHEHDSDGVWLMLAKKGVASPTSVTYAAALEEALCSGWIDGQSKSIDDRVYRQRFTPRRARSIWSQRNVGIVARLDAEGRLRPRGVAEIERAKADGRWDRAYAGSATAEPPAALVAALEGAPEARAAFAALSRSERYSALHPLLVAATPATLERRIEKLVARLLSG